MPDRDVLRTKEPSLPLAPPATLAALPGRDLTHLPTYPTIYYIYLSIYLPIYLSKKNPIFFSVFFFVLLTRLRSPLQLFQKHSLGCLHWCSARARRGDLLNLVVVIVCAGLVAVIVCARLCRCGSLNPNSYMLLL